MTIVVMHGFGAFMHLLASRSILPLVETLSMSGRNIHAPIVHPYNTVEERAVQWMSHLDELGPNKKSGIHLIAFSSGGLDARYLISHLGGYEFVKTLTTISTPHLGSSLAEYILERPASIQKGVTAMADWMGNRLVGPDVSASKRSLERLTPTYMTEIFNPRTPDHPDVRYRSWAGAAGVGTTIPIMPLLRLSNRVVFDREGPNDGIVSVSSATRPAYCGTLDADHARQIGIKGFNGTFDAGGFVSALVHELEEGDLPE
jgi:triacylglycerol lipase